MKKKKFKEGPSPILLPRNTWFPFEEHRYKIYKDGRHFVGTYSKQTLHCSSSVKKEKTIEEKCFDSLYLNLLQNDTLPRKMYGELKKSMLDNFSCVENIDEFLSKNIKRKRRNFFLRKKRLKRKADLNLWNKWVTITYDDKKHTEESFRKKLRKCLSNLHTRHKWKYMGVFEYSPVEKRLHFHAIMYIPDLDKIGQTNIVRDFSTKTKKMQVTHSNSFFAKKFGRNDFADISENELLMGDSLDYLTKYIQKNNEKIVYSRGIPSEIYMTIEDKDIAAEMYDYCHKVIFFDDVIDIKEDVMKFKPIQGNMFDSYYIKAMAG